MRALGGGGNRSKASSSGFEARAQAILLYGKPVGCTQMLFTFKVPTGTTSGEVGVVYGYKSGADYWLRVIDLTGPRVRSYHVVNGVRTSILNIGAATVTPGSNYVTQFTHSRRELKYNGTFPFGSAGLPSGRVGLFTTIAGASCSQLTFEDDSESREVAHGITATTRTRRHLGRRRR